MKYFYHRVIMLIYHPELPNLTTLPYLPQIFFSEIKYIRVDWIPHVPLPIPFSPPLSEATTILKWFLYPSRSCLYSFLNSCIHK